MENNSQNPQESNHQKQWPAYQEDQEQREQARFGEDRDEETEEEEDEDEESPNSDWGTVDPLEHPGPPSDMDPSAPGSAV